MPVIDPAPGDGTLVERTLRGETSAFATLHRRYARTVYGVVAPDVFDPEERADAVQEIFTRALERLPQLRDAERFRPWLLAIARNTVTDLQRVGGRAPKRQELFDEHEAVAPSPDELAELADLVQMVDGCVSGLSSRDATAVSLVVHLDFGVADVARAIGVSESTARVVLHRARRRLRDAMVLLSLVRGRTEGCIELQKLRADDDPVSAEKHARECADCLGLLRRELLSRRG